MTLTAVTLGSAGLLLALAAAPAVPGIANRVKSALTGRRGAPVLQLYSDLAKLWRKGVVYSRTTTALFRARAACAAARPCSWRPPCCRSTASRAAFGFAGDLVAFAGLLALGRFALVLAALDTGSSFEGMGASREVTSRRSREPALFLCFTRARARDRRAAPAGHAGSPGSRTSGPPRRRRSSLAGAALFAAVARRDLPRPRWTIRSRTSS